MMHYILEVWLWMLGLFLIGCLIGALAWRRFGKASASPEKLTDPQPGPPHRGEGEEAV
jgi:hypothetical protein